MIKDKAFDYSQKRGVGKKAYENYMQGVKDVMIEINKAFQIGGIGSMVECYNTILEELKH